MKKKIIAFCCLLSLYLPTKANSYESRSITKLPQVNLITWYGYFKASLIKELENQCKVRIYLDQYYSNSAFMRRLQSGSFDLAIYSDNMHPYFLDLIETPGTNFGYLHRTQYPERMKKLIAPYNSDTVLFQLGATGIMYDPDKITVERDTSINSLFKKAQGGLVSILDEQFEALHMVQNAGLSNSSAPLDSQLKQLPKLLSGTYPLVTTELGRIHEDDKFIFAYNWSGDAIKHIDDYGLDYRFTLLDDLSHISIDVLTLINDKPNTVCVAQMMATPSYLRKVSEYSKFISPYHTIYDFKNPDQTEVALAIQNINTPIKPPLTSGVDLNAEQGERLLIDWNQVKIQLSPEVQIDPE